jgi:MFS family permease
MKAGDPSVRQCVRARPFLFLILAIFLYSVAFNAIISHLSALLTDRGMSLRHSAEALSLLGACGLAGRMALGLVLDKVSAVRVSLLLFVVTAIGLVLLSQGSSHTAFVAIALLGFAAGGESDITPYLLSRYFGLRSFATLYGMAWTAFAAGAAVGSTLMGKLFAVTGGYAPDGIRLFAIPAALSALLMAIMPKYPPLQDQSPIPERTVARPLATAARFVHDSVRVEPSKAGIAIGTTP